jgi:hypothetical protein
MLPFHLANVLKELQEREGGNPHVIDIHSISRGTLEQHTVYFDICGCPTTDTLIIRIQDIGEIDCRKIRYALSLGEDETKHWSFSSPSRWEKRADWESILRLSPGSRVTLFAKRSFSVCAYRQGHLCFSFPVELRLA